MLLLQQTQEGGDPMMIYSMKTRGSVIHLSVVCLRTVMT
jgi:hypothetical protein